MFKKINNTNGFTLVEVLASTVILTLLLTSFLIVFIQSVKTNKTSEHIIDATYIAQTEMEEIYAISIKTKYGSRDMTLRGLNYIKKEDESGWSVFERNRDTGELIKVKLKNKKGTMDRVLIEVKDKDTLRAQMENVLVWKVDQE
ncbi:type IV pilus modification PilV family protein [Psychrobacillus sp. BM2]|uniref:type IV pilus modification PilV family protein n=1 Tax=Psychrobacillus sp. BM2 TaxID=3400421 RepID=UPI003B021C26